MISKGVSEVVKKKRIRKKKVVAEVVAAALPEGFQAMGIIRNEDGSFSRVDVRVSGNTAKILFVEEPMSRHNVRLDFSIAAQKRILDVL